MSASEAVPDVGEIAILKDECFWMIPERYVNSPKFYVCSPLFSYLGEKWRFELSGADERVDLFLRRKFRPNMSSDSAYTVQATLKSCTRKDVANCEGELEYDYGFEGVEFCSRKKLLDYNVVNCAQIKISFEIKEDIFEGEENEDESSSEDETTSDGENDEKKKAISKSKGIKRLAEDFKQVFLDGQMSDAVLKVESREFKVHKVVLVARSPVFASMFRHDLAEKKDNVVDIPDCKAESFEAFLHYLYSGSAEGLSKSNVYNVYYAADKYHVDDLKRKCLKFLTRNISVESCCDVIALSLHHGESKLQEVATRFFRENVRNIIKTVQWQKYMAEKSTQANELLIKALNV